MKEDEEAERGSGKGIGTGKIKQEPMDDMPAKG